MAFYESPSAISVTVEHVPDDRVTVAHFEWQDEIETAVSNYPRDTYTIDVEDDISVAFDRHTPVRPREVRWVQSSNLGDETVLDDLFGQNLTEKMRELRLSVNTARAIGVSVLELVLTRHNRRNLAELQLHSPSTPIIIKKAVGGMLSEIVQKDDAA